MLHFTFGTPATFQLTLSELVTLESPFFLFVFKRRVPGRTLALVLSPESSTDRSDEFALDVDALFAGFETGQYTYDVYEQDNILNTDPANAGVRLEQGVMHLHPATPFAFTMRDAATSYTTR